MIKELIFKKTDSLADEIVKINFGSKTNIIIGPKGGGKSTLFDLVAGLKESYISKNVIEALAAFNLEFIKVIKFNGEEIHSNSLRKITAKDKEKLFAERNDVIYQDDPIKKNLNNRKEIEKAKVEFAKEECENSEAVEEFLQKIDSFYYGMNALAKRNNKSDINWTNSFIVKEVSNTENDLMLKLNYSTMYLNTDLSKEKNSLEEALRNYQNQNMINKKLLQKEWNQKLIDQEFIDNFNKSIEALIKINNNIIQGINKQLSKLDKIKLMSMIFEKSYKKEVDSIKNQDFEIEGIKSFVINSNEHFRTMAREIQQQKKTFESLVQEEVVIEFKNVTKDNALLSYKMPEEVILKDGDVYALLKTVLHTPGSSVADITKWLEAIIKKGVKPLDRNKLLNKLSKIVQEEVIVLANGRVYEHMSLGQRSIYGIEYKFNKSKGQDLFLDQPEDNLDNHTIASDILELINKKDEQVFIVTHNANIGILSNPEATIVADLNNEQEQYSEGTIVKTKTGESDAAHYLEGGVVYLKKRYKVIEGEQNDNKN
ncbi:ABC transporter ATP-binding protein [Mycoplasma todarodis]|uniref:Rad50/SbcC-type AAA domain-containing protein n=1 Tax=Mycoplasma todarodis TaxID=1937191 RepID=A0A4R0XPU2_9MOLU|nr:ABC transporter ATP-binding protein [Mycoplasma todarodis]TCG11572.1 hypothetical protein C4B25_01160 [Mycoplasma todarodis]